MDAVNNNLNNTNSKHWKRCGEVWTDRVISQLLTVINAVNNNIDNRSV
jgi:hypothetical protein